MRKLLDSIATRNLNTVQRSGYFATIVGCLILIVLHNPMSSYDLYQSKYYGYNQSGPQIHISRITGRAFKYEGNYIRESINDIIDIYSASEQCLDAAELYHSVDEEPSGSPEKKRVENEAMATLNRLDCYGDWFKPFSEWKTHSPLVAWLGNVVNLLFSIFSVLGVGCFWLFVFRTTNPVGTDN